MNIKNTYLGLKAYLKFSKEERKAFHGLAKHERKKFFQLGTAQREEFIVFVEILSQNTSSKINKKVKKASRHTGAPAVEYFEYLTLEAKRQTNYAHQKINNITADPNIKTKDQTDIVTMGNARDVRDRFNLLNEQLRMEQFQNRSPNR